MSEPLSEEALKRIEQEAYYWESLSVIERLTAEVRRLQGEIAQLRADRLGWENRASRMAEEVNHLHMQNHDLLRHIAERSQVRVVGTVEAELARLRTENASLVEQIQGLEKRWEQIHP